MATSYTAPFVSSLSDGKVVVLAQRDRDPAAQATRYNPQTESRNGERPHPVAVAGHRVGLARAHGHPGPDQEISRGGYKPQSYWYRMAFDSSEIGS